MKLAWGQAWLTARAAGMLVLVSFVAVLISLTVSGDNHWDALLVATTVTGFTALGLILILIAHKSARKRALGFGFLVALLGLLGASRGWFFFTMSELLALEDPANLGVRILNSTLSTVLWGSMFVAIDSRLAHFHRVYRDLVASRTERVLALPIKKTAGVAELIDQSSELVNFQSTIRDIAKRANRESIGPAELQTAARLIREEMENSLRPLSKRIWLDANDSQPRFRWIEVFQESLRQLPFNWWRVATAASLAYLVGLLSLVDQTQALVQATGYAAALHLALFLTKKFRRLGSWRSGLLWVSLSATAGSFGAIVAGGLALGTQMEPTSLPQYFLGPISGFGFIVSGAIWSQLRTDWELINKIAAEDSTDSTLLGMRLAGFLHNSVQSRVNSLAFALERIDPADRAGLKEIAQELEALASKSIGAEFAQAISNPLGKLERLADAWSRIIEVEYLLDESVRSHPHLGLVVELIEEAISNAVRHSGAKHISIAILGSDRGLQVRMTHSSSASERGKKSVGMEWLERFTLDYRVRNLPNGNRELSVLI